MSFFVRENGTVDLERLAQVPTVVHVIGHRQVDARELEKYLEGSLGSPVYAAVYFGTEQPTMDVYAFVSVERLLGVLSKHERVLKAEVRRRRDP